MSYTPPPPPPPGQGGYGGYAQPQQNQKAMWSMILGILGLICCGFLAGIPAVILGNAARKEILAAGGAQTGEGMAKAGVILGWIAIALGVLGLIIAVTTGAFSSYNTM